jgi:hypothetical protein
MLVILWNPSPWRSAHRTASARRRSTLSVTRHRVQYASDGDFTKVPLILNSRQWIQNPQCSSGSFFPGRHWTLPFIVGIIRESSSVMWIKSHMDNFFFLIISIHHEQVLISRYYSPYCNNSRESIIIVTMRTISKSLFNAVTFIRSKLKNEKS